MSVAVSYQLLTRDIDRTLETTANRASVKLESEYYLAHIADVASLDDFLADARLFRYAMNAFGLGDLDYARGYMRKILEEGVSDPLSLANRTNDPKIRAFAETFDFDTYGDLTAARAATREAVVDRYVRQTLEETAGAQDGEGVRLALYFERQAPEIGSVYDILADQALFAVVRTVLGLPESFSAVDIERQAAVLGERVDLEEFKDPEALRQFLTRFTAVWDATEASQTDPILSLFNTSTQPTISLDLVLAFQAFRQGGA